MLSVLAHSYHSATRGKLQTPKRNEGGGVKDEKHSGMCAEHTDTAFQRSNETKSGIKR